MIEFLKRGIGEITTLSGIKFTSNDLDEGEKCLRVHEDLTIFLGADTVGHYVVYTNLKHTLFSLD